MSANIIYRGRYGEYLVTNNIGFACWGVIVKRRLLEDKKVLFDVGLSISEDVVWNLSLAYHCPDADFMVTDLRVVKYIVNANSTVNTVNAKKNYRHMEASLRFAKLVSSNMFEAPHMDVPLKFYRERSINQVITRFLSCKLSNKITKAKIIDIKRLINIVGVDNRIVSVFNVISRSVTFTTVVQSLYRNIFLRYIKPSLRRN